MFLSAVRPFIRKNCEIQLRVKREGSALSLTIIPKIDGLDPDTDDAALAALKAALSKPFHLHVADGQDPDRALADALTSIGQAQASVHDDLEKYTAQIEADRVAAKEAAEKKKVDDKAKANDKTKKIAPAAKPAKAPITKSAPDAGEDTKPPAPVVAIDLFNAPPAPLAATAEPEQAAAVVVDDSGQVDTTATGENAQAQGASHE